MTHLFGFVIIKYSWFKWTYYNNRQNHYSYTSGNNYRPLMWTKAESQIHLQSDQFITLWLWQTLSYACTCHSHPILKELKFRGVSIRLKACFPQWMSKHILTPHLSFFFLSLSLRPWILKASVLSLCTAPFCPLSEPENIPPKEF